VQVEPDPVEHVWLELVPLLKSNLTVIEMGPVTLPPALVVLTVARILHIELVASW
jgi:hypothetical protein